jgi:hypothetical protein
VSTESNATAPDEVRAAAIAAGVAEHDTYSMRLFATAYAAGRRAAAVDVQLMSHELGDEGWDEMCRRAEKAGYDRQVVLRRRRGDFTTTNVEAAYQVGRDFAARVAAGVR